MLNVDFLLLYPVNPQNLAQFRKAFYPSGAKIFRLLLKHPTLKRVSVGMGSFHKNREVRTLFTGSQVLVDGAFGTVKRRAEDNNRLQQAKQVSRR
jgi:hypothetical protein